MSMADASAQTVIRTNDYDGGATSDPTYAHVSFAGAAVNTPVAGFAGLGVGTNVFAGNLLRNAEGEPTVGSGGTFTNLPLGGTLSFSFLLALIDSWDGADSANGPDRFGLEINGVEVYVTTLSNFPPSRTNGGTLIATGSYIGNALYPDSAWDFTNVAGLQNIAYGGTTVTYRIGAGGPNYFGGTDESWGVDNFRVTLNVAAPIPEPETYALMLAGLGLIGAIARRKK
jgi:hypothetical protein